jgi:hypothetical protein
MNHFSFSKKTALFAQQLHHRVVSVAGSDVDPLLRQARETAGDR